MNSEVADIPRDILWPADFPSQAAVDAVRDAGLDPSSIATIGQLPIGGSVSRCLPAYRTIGANDWVLATLDTNIVFLASTVIPLTKGVKLTPYQMNCQGKFSLRRLNSWLPKMQFVK